jgi:hypothetical protein
MRERREGKQLQRGFEEEKHLQAILDDLRAHREAAQIAKEARARAAAQERQEALLDRQMHTTLAA